MFNSAGRRDFEHANTTALTWCAGRLQTTTVVLGKWVERGELVAGHATTAADHGLLVGRWQGGQLAIEARVDGHPSDSPARAQRILRMLEGEDRV